MHVSNSLPFLSKITTETLETGGRLKDYLSEWEKLTSDQYILSIVAGYKIEFGPDGPPCQIRTPYPYKLNDSEKQAVDAEIARLFINGVIEPTHERDGFVSNIFTRPKKDGNYRMILDLSKLNEHIEYLHFKMDSFETAVTLISQGCFMASIDLRDAYYSVSIASVDRKYLQFFWNGVGWQFKALPNGLASGPRIFTKLLKPPLAVLRSMGVTIVTYIDDSLIIAKTKQEGLEAVENVATLLSKLGFVIHPEKSIFTPQQEIQFLGFIIDSKSMQVRLTKDRKADIKSACSEILEGCHHSIRLVASAVGKLVAAFPGVELGPLHYRQIEKEKTLALKSNYGHFDRPMKLSILAKIELQWWLKNVETAVRHINKGPYYVTITSDASGRGWGATNGITDIGGRWNAQESLRARKNEINYLEMLAAFLGLQAFCSDVRKAHILCRIDNTTAVAYINNMGGSKSAACNEMAKTIWTWCVERDIWLTAAHVPGVLNKVADRQSRVFNDKLEWMLNREVFLRVINLFGEPNIDLFASRLNAQLDKYVSWKPDPGAVACDAFTLDWHSYFFYAFPPFSLISKCLRKVEHDKARGIMIVPKWPTQPWFGRLLNLLVEEPLILPRVKNLVTQPSSGDPHELNKSLVLMSCRLSGRPTDSSTFQRRLPKSSCPPGGIPPNFNTKHTSNSGWNFVVHGRLIRSKLMWAK